MKIGIVLLFLVGIQLRNNGMDGLINRRGMGLCRGDAIQSIGGLINAFILDLPITWAEWPRFRGWYSLFGILLTESFISNRERGVH